MPTKIYNCSDCEFQWFCGSEPRHSKVPYSKDGNCKHFTEARRAGDSAKKKYYDEDEYRSENEDWYSEE